MVSRLESADSWVFRTVEDHRDAVFGSLRGRSRAPMAIFARSELSIVNADDTAVMGIA